MFSRDFYPTPSKVIEQMCADLDLVGKTVLEPSAGSGNIVSWLQEAGANVLACEIHPDLAKIVAAKCQFLKDDFLSVQESDVSHVDFIIMNPPFSADEKHILHAWNVAPPGCEVISLCNMNTLENCRFNNREKLSEIISGNGFSQNMGPVFSGAEHKTDVPIGLVHLYKPRVNGEEFDGYFDTFDDADNDNQQNGLMSYNEIRNIVNRYVGAVKMFDSVIAKSSEINKLINPISDSLGISFGAFYVDERNRYNTITRDVFKKELQKSAWKSVFNKFNMHKYVTQSVISELNAFVEKQSNVPFTMSNVYKMIEMIIGTHRDRMDRILVHAFDEICSHSADNSTAGEKWKTNSNYKVNRRFIIPWMCDYQTWRSDTSHIHLYSGAYTRLDDIIKALCYLTGTPYETIEMLSNIENTYWGEWVHWAFFRVRGYKKGTMHFEFTDEKVWELFNRRVAEIKGWQLPRKTDNKTKGTEHVKAFDLQLF